MDRAADAADERARASSSSAVTIHPLLRDAFAGGKITSLVGADVSDLGGCAKWYDAVLAPSDGCVYCVPFGARRVLRIDPKTQAATPIGDDLSALGDYKFACGALAPDGCIYCPPFGANRVLRIDPASRSATLVGDDLSAEGERAAAARRASLAPHRRSSLRPSAKRSRSRRGPRRVEFGAPIERPSSSSRGVRRAAVRFEDRSAHPDLDRSRMNRARCRYQLSVLSRDRARSPLRAAPRVARSGKSKWFGAAVGRDGKIYCPPFGSGNGVAGGVMQVTESHVLCIDPTGESAGAARRGGHGGGGTTVRTRLIGGDLSRLGGSLWSARSPCC